MWIPVFMLCTGWISRATLNQPFLPPSWPSEEDNDLVLVYKYIIQHQNSADKRRILSRSRHFYIADVLKTKKLAIPTSNVCSKKCCLLLEQCLESSFGNKGVSSNLKDTFKVYDYLTSRRESHSFLILWHFFLPFSEHHCFIDTQLISNLYQINPHIRSTQS